MHKKWMRSPWSPNIEQWTVIVCGLCAAWLVPFLPVFDRRPLDGEMVTLMITIWSLYRSRNR
jgi:hypothetical protein